MDKGQIHVKPQTKGQEEPLTDVYLAPPFLCKGEKAEVQKGKVIYFLKVTEELPAKEEKSISPDSQTRMSSMTFSCLSSSTGDPNQ